jgi:hypothetical protein
VIAWNAQGRNTTSWLRLPVSGPGYTVTDRSTGAVLPSQAVPLDGRTKSLPLLYINRAGMSAAQVAAEVARLSNKATHTLTFAAPLPPVGFSTFKVVCRVIVPSLLHRLNRCTRFVCAGLLSASL